MTRAAFFCKCPSIACGAPVRDASSGLRCSRPWSARSGVRRRRRVRARRRAGVRPASRTRGHRGRGRRGHPGGDREGEGPEHTAEQRIANGELLYRSEGLQPRRRRLQRDRREVSRPPRPTPTRSASLGETYFRSKQYLSARRDFRQIVDAGHEPRFSPTSARRSGASSTCRCASRTTRRSTRSSPRSTRCRPSAVESGLSVRQGQGPLLQEGLSPAPRPRSPRVDAQSEYTTRPGTSSASSR